MTGWSRRLQRGRRGQSSVGAMALPDDATRASVVPSTGTPRGGVQHASPVMINAPRADGSG